MNDRLIEMRRTRAWWCVALFVAVLLPVATLRAQDTPQLRLVEPRDGATVDGPVTVRVEHSGTTFDGVKIGQAPEPGVGHWHVNVDGQYAGLAVSNVLEIPNDAVPTIAAGQHTITVDLHQNNHAATDPPVSESFDINLSTPLTLSGTAAGAPAAAAATIGDAAAGHSESQLPHTGMISDRALVFMLVAASLLGSGVIVHFVHNLRFSRQVCRYLVRRNRAMAANTRYSANRSAQSSRWDVHDSSHRR